MGAKSCDDVSQLPLPLMHQRHTELHRKTIGHMTDRLHDVALLAAGRQVDDRPGAQVTEGLLASHSLRPFDEEEVLGHVRRPTGEISTPAKGVVLQLYGAHRAKAF